MATEFTGITPELYHMVIAVVDQRMAEIKVTRTDFDDLKEVVKELAEAQKRTGERVEELAEAQRRTEERMEELAEAQRRTEKRMEELAEAQKRTAVELRQMARQVGSLATTVGFGLEDIARVVLPGYLERNLGVKIDKLIRKHIDTDGEPLEIDLFGPGSKDGRPVTVLGEVKARIYSREVKAFARKVARAEASLQGEVLKVMFGYLIHPAASELAAQEGIILVASYER